MSVGREGGEGQKSGRGPFVWPFVSVPNVWLRNLPPSTTNCSVSGLLFRSSDTVANKYRLLPPVFASFLPHLELPEPPLAQDLLAGNVVRLRHGGHDLVHGGLAVAPLPDGGPVDAEFALGARQRPPGGEEGLDELGGVTTAPEVLTEHVTDLGPAKLAAREMLAAADADPLACRPQADGEVVVVGVVGRQVLGQIGPCLVHVRVDAAGRRPPHDLWLRAQDVQRVQIIWGDGPQDKTLGDDGLPRGVRRQRYCRQDGFYCHEVERLDVGHVRSRLPPRRVFFHHADELVVL
ncbi:hypothetical protein CTA2_4163 [Colletotrichum tanaceti]|uniref:Uncharacterized protein n=1 Tax=Colletotrichum tanaceti TaxID=1306861 RepID=A0A4U6XR62_9PEZI|nr:hypothetical protein CTA2_4163 [Colletotrichum tanaceti]TKW58292.1 hypothetical protein CTA1_12085 [Colletotrichum tanaceti]